MTSVDKRVVLYKQKGGGISGKVGNPFKQLVMKICENAALLEIKLMGDGKCCPIPVLAEGDV